MSDILKAIIIDDERLARNVLKSHLSEFSEIEIVGEADNVKTAIDVIKKTIPDVIFLDIQMPGESGFDLLDKIKINFEIIFITAYDKHAIRAFEVNALDYLLKPIKKARLKNSIHRLLDKSVPDKNAPSAQYNDKLMLHIDGYVKLVSINKIIKVIADRDYSIVSLCDGKEIRLLKTLKLWEEKLPSNYFYRVHRSTIINSEYIQKIIKAENHVYKIHMHNIKEPVIMSRRFSVSLKSKLQF